MLFSLNHVCIEKKFCGDLIDIIITCPLSHWIGSNRKNSLQSTNRDQKLLETVFSMAICHQLGDKWQSKTMFLRIFDLSSSIVLTFSIVAYLVYVSVILFLCTSQKH